MKATPWPSNLMAIFVNVQSCFIQGWETHWLDSSILTFKKLSIWNIFSSQVILSQKPYINEKSIPLRWLLHEQHQHSLSPLYCSHKGSNLRHKRPDSYSLVHLDEMRRTSSILSLKRSRVTPWIATLTN